MIKCKDCVLLDKCPSGQRCVKINEDFERLCPIGYCELKPCPFCGGEAEIREVLGKLYVHPIHKPHCIIKPDTWLQSSLPIKKQIKAWNRRVGND